MVNQRAIAVSADERSQFGCPFCGYRSGYVPVSSGGTAAVVCGECEQSFAVLADGVKRSAIGFGSHGYRPRLISHPRKGIPGHGRPDKRPEGGGEFFASRGIGLDTTPGCFVCGGSTALRNNIAAFVQGKDAGERIARMLQQGVRVDFRTHEPDRVQVKIGACNQHRPNLERLHTLTHEHEGVITSEIIQTAIAA